MLAAARADAESATTRNAPSDAAPDAAGHAPEAVDEANDGLATVAGLAQLAAAVLRPVPVGGPVPPPELNTVPLMLALTPTYPDAADDVPCVLALIVFRSASATAASGPGRLSATVQRQLLVTRTDVIDLEVCGLSVLACKGPGAAGSGSADPRRAVRSPPPPPVPAHGPGRLQLGCLRI